LTDSGKRDEAIRPLIPLLIDLQRSLDGPLNLTRLAASVGYSRYHFHRIFTSTVGETPRAHIERLRMEKAAYKLWITADTVLEVALSIGFRSHETFSRAFKRYFGRSPQAFRKDGRATKRRHVSQYPPLAPDDCILSDVRYETLREMPLLALRRMGPYSTTPQPGAPRDRHWRVLLDWARKNRVPFQPHAVCIFYDNPWLTPEPQQRADLCVPLAAAVAGTRTFRCTRLAGGRYAAITHMGPLATRPRAFRVLADAVHASDTYAFPAEPAAAISVTSLDGAEGTVRSTDVYLPVIKKG